MDIRLFALRGSRANRRDLRGSEFQGIIGSEESPSVSTGKLLLESQGRKVPHPDPTSAGHVAERFECRRSARSVGVDPISAVSDGTRISLTCGSVQISGTGGCVRAVRPVPSGRIVTRDVHYRGSGRRGRDASGGSVIDERARSRIGRIPDESADFRLSGYGKVPHHRSLLRIGRNARDLKKRNRTGLSVGRRRERRVHGAYGKRARVINGKRLAENRTELRNFELFGIHLELRVIGISSGIVRSGFVPIPAGENHRLAVDVRDRSRKRGAGIVDYVIPRGISGNGGFRSYGGKYRTGISLYGCGFSIPRIPRQRQETYGRKYGQNGDDDYELHQGKGGAKFAKARGFQISFGKS